MSPGFRIVLLCTAAAIVYGMVMDQITVRVCPEYFTVAHPRIRFIPQDSLTLLALFWGVTATWWVGVLLGVPLALACRAGSLPRLKAGYVVRPLAILLGVMAAATLIAGISGYMLARRGVVTPSDWQWHIPQSAHVGFVADAFAHLAAYACGFFGGIVIIVMALRRRRLAVAIGKAKEPDS
jgi:hypothetical protein